MWEVKRILAFLVLNSTLAAAIRVSHRRWRGHISEKVFYVSGGGTRTPTVYFCKMWGGDSFSVGAVDEEKLKEE